MLPKYAACAICLCLFVMDWTIDLNHKPKGRGVKINHKISDWLLTPKLYAIQPLSTQGAPKDSFSFGWLFSKLPRNFHHFSTDLRRNDETGKVIFHL